VRERASARERKREKSIREREGEKSIRAGEGNSHPSGTSPRYLVKKTTGQLFQVLTIYYIIKMSIGMPLLRSLFLIHKESNESR
jgi:hypothetical protein